MSSGVPLTTTAAAEKPEQSKQPKYLISSFIMSIINVLIAVDVEGALASGNLQNNVYLVDTNKYMGSYNQGSELVTDCHDMDTIQWSVTPIAPQNNVSINSFTGQAIDNKICVPSQQGVAPDVYWQGTVETQGNTGQYQYSVVLSFEGKTMSFDPFLNVIK